MKSIVGALRRGSTSKQTVTCAIRYDTIVLTHAWKTFGKTPLGKVCASRLLPDRELCPTPAGEAEPNAISLQW